MKKNIIALFALGAILTAGAEGIQTAPDGYTLRWSDEFDGNALNERIWNIEVNGNGGGNQELQYYRRENVAVGTDPATGESCLVLTARREDFAGKAFTSGRVTTQNKAAFKHGVLQARIKFPRTANGLWPAYWMMGNDMNQYGWPRCGEMDIVELGHFNGINAGTQDRYFGGTLHYGPNATNEGHQILSQEYLAPADNPITNDEYHIITVEWDDNNLYMYYDLPGWTAANKRNARYFSTNIPYSDEEMTPGHYFQKPFFFLLNLAVGGSYTNIYQAGGITALPNPGSEAKMYVDWVRVYQKNDDTNALYTYVDENGNTVTNIEQDPEPDPDPDDYTELSGFATEALDADGNTTFDFSDVSDAVLISTSDGVNGHLLSAGANVTDYNVNDENRHLYIWENTYVPVDRSGQINSFGWEEGYTKLTVANVGWSGAGFNITGEDLSMIGNDWWLHFAMKGTDIDVHTSHQIQVRNAAFIIGNSDGALASLGDFKRDGKWYYFDIPVKALTEFDEPLFGTNPASYSDNIISFLSGGFTGAELCYDNIFFYKSKSKEIPHFTDKSSNLGKFGYKSLDENGAPVFNFAGVTDVVPLFLSGDTWESLTAGGTYGETSLVQEATDNSEQGGRNNFFVWDNTMKVKTVTDKVNSMGRVPYGGYPAYSSASGVAWNGSGWAAIAGQGMTPKPLNLSTIDDSYYLHLSLRSDAAVSHIPVMIRLGAEDADCTLVFGTYSSKPTIGDFNRDGEWYSFDIPVTELKKYGLLWSRAGNNLASFGDYSLCIYTDKTFYGNSWFSLDNVFFYTKGDTPDVNELGDYGSLSLDANGASTFDLTQKEYILLSANGSVIEQIHSLNGDEAILGDYREGVGSSHFYVWDGTYTGGSQSQTVPDSFGGDEGWIDLCVGSVGWSGAGHVCDSGADLSMLTDDWYLHFAMRGTDNSCHQIALGEAKFTIGATPFAGGIPVLGNYLRDGKWYSFDIPYSVIRNLSSDIFPANNGPRSKYTGNIVWYLSGGHSGDELQIDNLFLWHKRSSGIEAPAETAEAEAEIIGIYDICGRPVHNMDAPGLYIVVTTCGARKVMVR